MSRVAVLAAVALAARVGFLLAAARALGAPIADLALRYDGHVYLRIAKTLPHLYVDGGGPFLTGWFPLYPLLIRAASVLTGDLRLSAMLVSLSFSVASIVVFHRLAERFSKRPDFATFLFIFFPPMWLVVGDMGFVEPILVFSAMLAVLATLDQRPALLSLACVMAVLTQKSGFLVPVVAALILNKKALQPRWAAALLSSVLALAVLECYLWVEFGDPFINLKVQREVFGGALFGVPFQAFVRGLLEPAPFGGPLRKAVIALSGLFYLAAAAAAFRRRDAASKPLRAWLGATLAFFFCLGGVWAFHSLPRFLLLASPAAILALEPFVAETLYLLPLVLLPYFVGLVEAAQADGFWRRAWGEGYAERASKELR